jgi:hypothetical protein
MKYQIYHTQEINSFVHQFDSDGPKGKIMKRVTFKELDWLPGTYNLSFGDADVSGDLNDKVATNNGDAEKVLATVASIAYCFLKVDPLKSILFSATTSARMRLYRMLISNNYDEVISKVDIFGFDDENLEIFQKNKVCSAYLFKLKQ